MNEGSKYLRGVVPFRMIVQGEIDNKKFTVKGIGTGNASEGLVEGEFKCETGRLPMSWPALAMTLGYGSK